MNSHLYNRWNQQSTSMFDPPCLSSCRRKAKIVDSHNSGSLKVVLRPVFCPFLSIFFLLEKVYIFFVHILMCPHPYYNQTVTYWTKVFRKYVFLKWYSTEQFCFEISLFQQHFYRYITVYLVRKWTYKNADERAHTISRTKT